MLAETLTKEGAELSRLLLDLSEGEIDPLPQPLGSLSNSLIGYDLIKLLRIELAEVKYVTAENSEFVLL